MARVDFLKNAEDFQAALLGSLGFSSAFIEARTGLTIGQISYRLGKARIKRMAYRDGSSGVASLTLRLSMNGMVRDEVRNQVSRVQGEKPELRAYRPERRRMRKVV